MKKVGLSFLFILFLTTDLFSQNYPKDFFRLPVDTVVRLGGNFGEIRWDHFHYGWDVRTGGHERMKVVAAGDGYVSRVKTGAYGYGKVIYITHPNGFVSVYAHLSEFNIAIGQYVKAAQYKNETYETDLYPAKDELKIKKGEFIALSGNTGNSSGPHLHFEIRDEKTEEIINPYFFGLKIEDNIPPYFKTLAVYPTNDLVNGKNTEKYIPLVRKNGIYQFRSKDSIIVNGEVGFGIELYDKENNSNGNNQVFSLEFQVDGNRVYYYEMNKLAFDQTLYVNAHVDYMIQRKENKNIQKAFVLPGNKFPIYKDVINSGLVNFTDDKIHLGKFIAKDFYGNTAVFMFKIKSDPSIKGEKNDCIPFITNSPAKSLFPLKYDSTYELENGFKINFTKNTFFDDVCFPMGTLPAWSSLTSPVEKLHTQVYSKFAEAGSVFRPVFIKYEIKIKCDTLPQDSLRYKLLIVHIDGKQNISSKGGDYKDGWVSAKVGTLGSFVVVIDSTPPKIKAPIIPKSKNISKLKVLDFKVADNLTGIKYYRATIDGKWILLEYEPKKNSLFCKNDEHIPNGTHQLILKVTDGKANSSTLLFDYVK